MNIADELLNSILRDLKKLHGLINGEGERPEIQLHSTDGEFQRLADSAADWLPKGNEQQREICTSIFNMYKKSGKVSDKQLKVVKACYKYIMKTQAYE